MRRMMGIMASSANFSFDSCRAILEKTTKYGQKGGGCVRTALRTKAWGKDGNVQLGNLLLCFGVEATILCGKVTRQSNDDYFHNSLEDEAHQMKQLWSRLARGSHD